MAAVAALGRVQAWYFIKGPRCEDRNGRRNGDTMPTCVLPDHASQPSPGELQSAILGS
jgi:hypothetical protein